jgi:hypothetical protein
MTLGDPTRLSGAVEGAGHAAEDLVGEAGYAGSAEEGREVSRGEWWPLGVGGLLADDLQDGGRAEVELVEEEVVGVDCLQPERCQRGDGKSFALAVMMPCAPPRIAAASTCRSS